MGAGGGNFQRPWALLGGSAIPYEKDTGRFPPSFQLRDRVFSGENFPHPPNKPRALEGENPSARDSGIPKDPMP